MSGGGKEKSLIILDATGLAVFIVVVENYFLQAIIVYVCSFVAHNPFKRKKKSNLPIWKENKLFHLFMCLAKWLDFYVFSVWVDSDEKRLKLVPFFVAARIMESFVLLRKKHAEQEEEQFFNHIQFFLIAQSFSCAICRLLKKKFSLSCFSCLISNYFIFLMRFKCGFMLTWLD